MHVCMIKQVITYLQTCKYASIVILNWIINSITLWSSFHMQVPFNPRPLGTDLQLDNLGLLLVEQMATWSVMVCLPKQLGEGHTGYFCGLCNDLVFVLCLDKIMKWSSFFVSYIHSQNYLVFFCFFQQEITGLSVTAQLAPLVIQRPSWKSWYSSHVSGCFFSFFEMIPSIEKKKKERYK